MRRRYLADVQGDQGALACLARRQLPNDPTIRGLLTRREMLAALASIALVCADYAGYFIHLPHFSPAVESSIKWHIPYIADIYPLQNFGVKTLAILIIVLLPVIGTTPSTSTIRSVPPPPLTLTPTPRLARL